MALTQKQLQKKRNKKATKKKLNKSKKNIPAPNRSVLGDLPVHLASSAPIHECWFSDKFIKEDNIDKLGTVMISRKAPHGEFIIGNFLLDNCFHGVKNAFIRVVTREEYKYVLNGIKNNENLISATPSCARKLVESSIKYAANLGISPHKDYHDAKLIFGDIDPDQCTEEFIFGFKGKPFYMPGHFDTDADQARVVRQMYKKKAGKTEIRNKGYYYE
ncbi:conserved hypothetical protein [Desulfamplus magnetovallimortis]|uniref:Uncharacterized protein n=1 Tax=Desulfamplus magnetovallimortis TaxID=1246637 RepID=A0A1W1HDK7_9BACT|nr:hypothetical protein [Desulfamplus magnetovallimortis]SLM30584.1 conserved hypothetical protein [Desulfamplus magnetovallimortis]